MSRLEEKDQQSQVIYASCVYIDFLSIFCAGLEIAESAEKRCTEETMTLKCVVQPTKLSNSVTMEKPVAINLSISSAQAKNLFSGRDTSKHLKSKKQPRIILVYYRPALAESLVSADISSQGIGPSSCFG